MAGRAASVRGVVVFEALHAFHGTLRRVGVVARGARGGAGGRGGGRGAAYVTEVVGCGTGVHGGAAVEGGGEGVVEVS